MFNRKVLAISMIIFCIFVSLVSCNEDSIFPETTLELWAYVEVDNNIEFVQLEEGSVYTHSTERISTSNCLTVKSNGYVTAVSPDQGTYFNTGDVENDALIAITTSHLEAFSASGGGTFGVGIRPLENELWETTSPPNGTTREIVISAWGEHRRDKEANPDIAITLQIKQVSRGIPTYEILSIERTPPAH